MFPSDSNVYQQMNMHNSSDVKTGFFFGKTGYRFVKTGFLPVT